MSIKACRLTAAVSTPVGPPPHMTKLRRRFLSSGDVVGRLASSKLSRHRGKLRQEEWHKVIPIIRRRIDWASLIVFNCRQFSKPGTPWVLEEEPTAMTSLSYLNDVSKPQVRFM